MQVNIKGTIHDLRVSTITLQPEEGNNMYSFHCSSCGNFLQQVGGIVSKIYPFYEPSNDVPVISTCPRCGKKYTFQSHDGYLSDKVRVILHPTEDHNYFYCASGKHRILEFTRSAVSTMDGKLKGIPFEVNCPGESCLRVYFIAEMI